MTIQTTAMKLFTLYLLLLLPLSSATRRGRYYDRQLMGSSSKGATGHEPQQMKLRRVAASPLNKRREFRSEVAVSKAHKNSGHVDGFSDRVLLLCHLFGHHHHSHSGKGKSGKGKSGSRRIRGRDLLSEDKGVPRQQSHRSLKGKKNTYGGQMEMADEESSFTTESVPCGKGYGNCNEFGGSEAGSSASSSSSGKKGGTSEGAPCGKGDTNCSEFGGTEAGSSASSSSSGKKGSSFGETETGTTSGKKGGSFEGAGASSSGKKGSSFGETETGTTSGKKGGSFEGASAEFSSESSDGSDEGDFEGASADFSSDPSEEDSSEGASADFSDDEEEEDFEEDFFFCPDEFDEEEMEECNFMILDVSCDLADGSDCATIQQNQDTQCAAGSPLGRMSFSFQPATCSSSDNAQSERTTCTDFAPIDPAARTRVVCYYDEVNFSLMDVSPSIVTVDTLFTIEPPAGRALPDILVCYLYSIEDSTMLQKISIDTSGEAPLQLFDKFGAMQVETCNEKTCMETLFYRVTVLNMGASVMGITLLEFTFGGETQELVRGLSVNPVASGRTSVVETNRRINTCLLSEHWADVHVHADSPQQRDCQSDAAFVAEVVMTMPPVADPSPSPSGIPSSSPSSPPSSIPSASPSTVPSKVPSISPTASPSGAPSATPSAMPSPAPSTAPSLSPSSSPSTAPSSAPSTSPSAGPSGQPSASPSRAPSTFPSTPPSTSPSSLPSSFPTYGPCDAMTTLACKTTDGNDCGTVLEPSNPQCAVGSRISTLAFSYQPDSCEASNNDQGSSSGCTAFASINPQTQARVVCEDGTSLFSFLQVEPSVVIPGGIVSVSSMTGIPLPTEVKCILYSDMTNQRLQEIVIDTSGTTDLKLRDRFGSFQVESCDDTSCREVLTYGVTVFNTGSSLMDITMLSFDFDGVQESLLTDLVSKELGSDESTSVVTSREVDVCSTDVYRVEIDVEATSPSGETCNANDRFLFETGPSFAGDESSTECASAFVYCPGRSTCFDSPGFNENLPAIGSGAEGTWGWSIEYDLTEGVVDNCEIWMGATGCDLSQGVQVGRATITPTLFHYCLDLDEYHSNAFQLYVGQCEANDGGMHQRPNSDGSCDPVDVAKYAQSVATYPLKSSDGPMVSVYSFYWNHTASYPWDSSYSAFPLGTKERNYLTAHVDVCPMASESPTLAPSTPPSSVPSQHPSVEPTPMPSQHPTNRPSASPSSHPSLEPSSSPSNKPSTPPSATPSSVPTTHPSSSPSNPPSPVPTTAPSVVPSENPTSAPSSKPSANPSSLPTNRPTKGPTSMPTMKPSTSPTPEPTQGPTGFSGTDTGEPSRAPTSAPVAGRPSEENPLSTEMPLATPTKTPSRNPTVAPSVAPSPNPVSQTTHSPISAPTRSPSEGRPSEENTLEVPTAVPLVDPSPAPVALPGTPSPTRAPSAAPTGGRPSYENPLTFPTAIPTVFDGTANQSPTSTAHPVSSPTASPSLFDENDVDEASCQEAWVYCPGRSTCFAASDFNHGMETSASSENGPWGWNIQYSHGDQTVGDCEIWVGAADCDFDQGVQVGTVTITAAIVLYCIHLPGYKAKSFQLYAGYCEGNDAGAHLDSLAGCNATEIAENARAVENYPLVHNQNEYVNTFYFDSSFNTTEKWNGYDVFPLGSTGRHYLSAHLEICHMTSTPSPNVAPTSVQVAYPTMSPSTMSAMQKTSWPTLSPVAMPTKPATIPPTSTPSSHPTEQPITSGPTGGPTTYEFTNTDDGDDDGCQEAFVYCPGRSTCFMDPAVNGGNEVFTESVHGAWGWSIEYNQDEDFVDDCEIWVGADNCDFSMGKKVGTAMITRDLFYFCLDIGEWVSTSFSLYAGQCPANDNAKHLNSAPSSFAQSEDTCNPADVAQYARDYQSYPLRSEDGPRVSIFSFVSSQQTTSGAWGEDYPVFPLGTSETRYISGRTYACPVQN